MLTEPLIFLLLLSCCAGLRTTLGLNALLYQHRFDDVTVQAGLSGTHSRRVCRALLLSVRRTLLHAVAAVFQFNNSHLVNINMSTRRLSSYKLAVGHRKLHRNWLLGLQITRCLPAVKVVMGRRVKLRTLSFRCTKRAVNLHDVIEARSAASSLH